MSEVHAEEIIKLLQEINNKLPEKQEAGITSILVEITSLHTSIQDIKEAVQNFKKDIDLLER